MKRAESKNHHACSHVAQHALKRQSNSQACGTKDSDQAGGLAPKSI